MQLDAAQEYCQQERVSRKDYAFIGRRHPAACSTLLVYEYGAVREKGSVLGSSERVPRASFKKTPKP